SWAAMATWQPAKPEAEHDKARFAWQTPEAAVAYRQSREPIRFKRYDREEAIISDWLRDLGDGGLVLDIPCGTGRFIRTVTQRGLRYLGADVSCAMIGEARRAGQCPGVVGFLSAEVERIPLADEAVDCVILWRL